MSILNLSCWLLQREIGGYCIGIICLLFCGVSRLVFCGCRSRADASFEDRSLSAITQHTVRVLFPLNLVLLTFWSYLEVLYGEDACPPLEHLCLLHCHGYGSAAVGRSLLGLGSPEPPMQVAIGRYTFRALWHATL